ncbi:hypothetical protein F2Q69_00022062 [Brassica cretica]|uniref:Uncharacterized protein n=1 Tax=Brassica cretica TaxID=69181 RepID=A0A8S9QCD8_BRACR|nr:hypothetical protein F2Q69_00022062 [Brassica cretica]
MTSRKRSSKKKTSPQSSFGNPCTNEEIFPTLCGSITSPPEVFYPTRPATVPSGVVFRVPVHGESAEDPPEGFFTCYEAFMTRCRMWFPIPEAIIRALDHFEMSISQLNVAALQNFLGVLILSYELGMDLSPDDYEGLWSTRKTSIDYSYRMAPKRHMSIIQGHTSNAKGWFEHFFYVQIDGTSVEENCLPLFCGKWTFHRGSGMQWRSTDREASPDLCVHRSWTSHTPALFPIRGRELGPERTSESLSKTETLSQKIFRYPDGTQVSPRVMGVEPARLLFWTTSLPTFLPVLLLQRHWLKRRGEKWSRKGIRVFNSTLDESFREARLSHFKAKEIERKFIHFQNEVAERERRQAESHSQALIRAERKGRRTIAAELARRATLFDAEFRSFKDGQDYVGDFRECRGSVGTLWKTQNADFSFLSEVAEMLASWMGAPRPSRWFLQSTGGSESFGNPSRFQRTRRKQELMLQTREEK